MITVSVLFWGTLFASDGETGLPVSVFCDKEEYFVAQQPRCVVSGQVGLVGQEVSVQTYLDGQKGGTLKTRLEAASDGQSAVGVLVWHPIPETGFTGQWTWDFSIAGKTRTVKFQVVGQKPDRVRRAEALECEGPAEAIYGQSFTLSINGQVPGQAERVRWVTPGTLGALTTLQSEDGRLQVVVQPGGARVEHLRFEADLGSGNPRVCTVRIRWPSQ